MCSSAGSARRRGRPAIRFVEPGTGEVVALRPDITPQIARVVATRMADVPGPIRLCYEGAVTRLAGEAGQREILQAGHRAHRCAASPTATPRCSRSRRRRSAALELPETRLDVGHVAPARFVLDAAPDARRASALAAALARKDRAGVRARGARAAGRASRRSPRRSSTLWGPARGDARARAARCRGPPTSRRARRLRAALAAFAELADRRRRRDDRSRRPARLRLLHRACGSPATRAARPMRCCAAAATTS